MSLHERNDASLRERYLDLVQASVLDTIHGTPPDHEDANFARFLAGFLEHTIHGRALSMLPARRLQHVRECARTLFEEGVPGDFMETGVWRGGATILMRALFEAWGEAERRVFAADSFQGLPRPDAERFPLEARAHDSRTMVEEYQHFAVSADEVRANFARFDLLDERVVFLEGWFEATLPAAPVEELALLRLDGDYFESTRCALEHLYPKLVPGGFLLIDDYGEDSWTYCRRAVDEYRAEHGIEEPLQQVDSKCFYWRRER